MRVIDIKTREVLYDEGQAMKGFSATIRIQADAVDEDSLVRKLTDVFESKHADFIADWEVDWHNTEETESNWEED